MVLVAVGVRFLKYALSYGEKDTIGERDKSEELLELVEAQSIGSPGPCVPDLCQSKQLEACIVRYSSEGKTSMLEVEVIILLVAFRSEALAPEAPGT